MLCLGCVIAEINQDASLCQMLILQGMDFGIKLIFSFSSQVVLLVALLTSLFLLVRIVKAWGSVKEESTGGERGLKGMGMEELRRREEELSRREVEREEERGVEEWQKRMQYDGGGAEVWDMSAMQKGKTGAVDDVQFIDVMRTKPKVSFSVSSTLDKLLQEERRLHNTNPRKVVELPWPAGPTVGGGVPILPKGGAGGISGVKASLKVHMQNAVYNI